MLRALIICPRFVRGTRRKATTERGTESSRRGGDYGRTELIVATRDMDTQNVRGAPSRQRAGVHGKATVSGSIASVSKLVFRR